MSKAEARPMDGIIAETIRKKFMAVNGIEEWPLKPENKGFNWNEIDMEFQGVVPSDVLDGVRNGTFKIIPEEFINSRA